MSRPEPGVPREEGRLSTGVAGLDAMLGGGWARGDANLVAGAPGTGKTTLGLQFLAAGIAAGEPGVFVTFEYLPQLIYRDARKRGWDMPRWEAEDKMRVVCTTPELLLNEVAPGRSLLDDAIAEIGAKRLVIDSLTAFEAHVRGAVPLRQSLAGLFNHLRLKGVSVVETYEIPQIAGPAMKVSEWGLEFLADSVVLLRYVEIEGTLQKAINILKFRAGDHDRRFRRYELTGKGLVVEGEFTGIEGISGGAARRSFGNRARELV
ncbi:MAG: circadian clock protein KaiC [Thermoplasmata archaeon]|jgi:circadian clock protein KaiC|nr:circadian clock protein KaiC [Thermoplasmata archaeon]